MPQVLNSNRTCHDVTLWEYLRCYFYSEYDLVGGKEKWEEIVEEYCKLLKDGNYSEMMELYREIIRLQATLQVVTDCCFLLTLRRNDKAIQYLKQLGYIYPLPEDDITTYMKSLDMIQRKSKTLVVQLQIKTDELEKLRAKQTGTYSESDFMDGVIIIGKFLGFRIDPRVVTLSEYASMQKQYNSYYEKKINEN